ncbi:MAG: NAD-dependent epimerase/dehydratase family protein [Bacteroidota bacterium]
MNAHSSSNNPSILITGGAGFIGSHLTDTLLADGWSVTVLDNLDPYYDPELKRANIALQADHPRYRFIEGDIRDGDLINQIEGEFTAIMHLAAKAGVRPSIKDPVTYMDVNVKGTQNLLEFARAREIKQFVFASSSSVYGVNPNVPWREDDYVLEPISPYASTKVSGELLGHVYSRLYGIRFIALRFFTVYGPRQRPDLAINKFVRKVKAGEEIPVFGDGSTRRDYTYVGDIVSGIKAALAYEDSLYEVINLGNGRTISLAEMIQAVETVVGKKALINRLPEQPGDVPQTYAAIDKATRLLRYAPQTTFLEGVQHFLDWTEQNTPAPVLSPEK